MADKRVRLSSRWKAVRYDEVRVRLGCPGLQRESASVQADRRDVGLPKRVQRDSDGGIETRAVVVGVSHVGVDRARGTGMRDRGRRLASTRRCGCGERPHSQGIESHATEPLGRRWRRLDPPERRGQVGLAKRTSRLLDPNVPGTSGTRCQWSPGHAQPPPARSTRNSNPMGSSCLAGGAGWAIRARRQARSIPLAPAWARGLLSGLLYLIKRAPVRAVTGASVRKGGGIGLSRRTARCALRGHPSKAQSATGLSVAARRHRPAPATPVESVRKGGHDRVRARTRNPACKCRRRWVVGQSEFCCVAASDSAVHMPPWHT